MSLALSASTTAAPRRSPTVLAEPQWRSERAAHEARVRPWVEPRLRRRSRGDRHPVDDFLFDYYPHRPAQLMRWHPGHGTVLAGDARDWLPRIEYGRTGDGVGTTWAALRARRAVVERVATLLRRTRERPPRFGCFGLHEWAMVYRLDQSQVRHPAWPLRLTPERIAAVVEAQPLRCTHFDAFRFYSPAAVPLNERHLTRATQVDDEQGGCLHAAMDLYRWSYTLSPFVGSRTVADAFALARHVRTVDMRAAPYDLRDLGLEPIRVETPEGRAEFVAEQRTVAAQADALRSRLLATLDGWLADPRMDG
jgi:hypothetical protein